MSQWGAKLIVCTSWILGSYLLCGFVWPRRFFPFAGLLVAMLYIGPLGIAQLQQSLSFPDEGTAQVPFIGFTVGLLVGPAAAIFLGYWATRKWWCYGVSQTLTVGFLIWVHLGQPEIH